MHGDGGRGEGQKMREKDDEGVFRFITHLVSARLGLCVAKKVSTQGSCLCYIQGDSHIT